MQKASSEQAERAGKIIRRMRDMVKKGRTQPPASSRPRRPDRRNPRLRRHRGEDRHATWWSTCPQTARIVVDRIMIEQGAAQPGEKRPQPCTPRPRFSPPRAGGPGSRRRMVEAAVARPRPRPRRSRCGTNLCPFYTTSGRYGDRPEAICRSIVEFHQGRLWVEPTRGRRRLPLHHYPSRKNMSDPSRPSTS